MEKSHFRYLLIFTVVLLGTGSRSFSQVEKKTDDKNNAEKSASKNSTESEATDQNSQKDVKPGVETTDGPEESKDTSQKKDADNQVDARRKELQDKCKHLKPRIESILKLYYKQKENSASRSPWGIMHAMVAFGPYAEMYGDGKLVKDVDWLCQNGRCRSWTLMKLENGRLSTNNGPGRQGHDGQFLAILAQSQIPKNKKLTVGGKEFTIEDLIQYEMKTCRPKTELTFKLIGLSHYIDSDARWRSNDGRFWSLERLVREELRQPINGTACGGTHRLMGYSYSLLMRKLQKKPITGHWRRAEDFVTDFRQYAMKLQNQDGSFSTDWFKQRQARRDSQRRVQTTGHILEWLVFSATEKELSDPRLIKAVDYLSNLMWSERTTEWEVGPKGHAIRALRLFYERALLEPADRVAERKSFDEKMMNLILR